jgi:flagellar motility protein MotE (MotC chaperone)
VQLINDLEKYINLRDSIKDLEKKKDEYYSIVEKLSSLQNLNDETGVNEIVESYLRR